MGFNNRVELTGFLGDDPNVIEKDGKTFLALSLATTDSYPVEENGETKWKDLETVWHDVLIFRKTTAQFARELKKGDRVQISGELSYRSFKTAEGHTRKAATIVARFVEKMHYEKQERLDYAAAANAVFSGQ
ncbi:single-stranded DNA-binding protein [Fibrisoma limi]|nr:single-stranded DNA-binding protein [Fibrisoma limi]